MSAHTSGPWTFDRPQFGFSAITGADGRLVFGIACGGADEKRSDDECDANARLIAAAPDLIAALRGLLAIAPENANDDDDPEQATAWTEARRVVAAARGGTS